MTMHYFIIIDGCVIVCVVGQQLGWGERFATCRPASKLSSQQQGFTANAISNRRHRTGKPDRNISPLIVSSVKLFTPNCTILHSAKQFGITVKQL